jgi:release factor glutamine methyltransferase
LEGGFHLTYREFQTFLVHRLGAFLDSREARAEAARWLAEGFDRPAAWLLAHGDEDVPGAQVDQAEAWLVRRERGEPWAHLLGWCPFRGRRFEVGPAVLIPRPETELVLEAALDVGRRLQVLHATDVGTGSGILGICLALETDWQVVATDVSRGALRMARRNAAALQAKVDFREGSLLGPVPDPVGLVVSNPPYVDPADRPTLQRELGFEPELALFAADRGLALATELLRQARVRHAPGVVLEMGAGQGAELRARAEAMGWARVAVHRDLADHDRILIALA